MQRARTFGFGSLFPSSRRKTRPASSKPESSNRPRNVYAEPLEERLMMALSKAGGGSGYSGCLSTNPTIRQQQLICDPNEPASGSTSVSYNPSLVTLAALEYGPGYGPRVIQDGEFFDVIQGYVEVAGNQGTFLQRIESFLDAPQGPETGYVQVYFQQTEGQPGQMTPPETNYIDEIAGVEGVDTHALYFDPVESADVITIDSQRTFAAAAAAAAPWLRGVPSYTIFPAFAGSHGNNAEDFMITQDGLRLGPADLSSATVTTNSGPQITSLTTSAGTLGTAASEGQAVSLAGQFFNLDGSDANNA